MCSRASRSSSSANGSSRWRRRGSSGCCTPSEANDAQVKLAWRYHLVRGKPSKKKIISRKGGYHGATVMAGSLTGLEVTHRGFHMPLDFVLHAEAAE